MRNALALTLVAGLASAATAQDSFSNNGSSDALNPYTANEQVLDYVVDLTPFTTSWGTPFGIAPIIKSSQADANFNNNLISGHAISKDILFGVPAVAPDYALWENAPGAGVNPTANDAAGSIAPSGVFNQQAVMLADFGTNSAGEDFNGIAGALINYDPANSARLYVRRVTAATNGANGAGNTAQLGAGSVDANGNAYYRADDFNTGAGSVTGNNLIRTRLADRDVGTLSQISGTLGLANATDGLLVGSGTTHVVPNNIPASIAGGNGAIATSNFDGDYVRGTAAAAAQFGAFQANGSTDNRGAVSTTTATPLGGDYTVAITQRNGGTENDSIGVFATDASGNILLPTATLLTLPATLSDPTNGFSLSIPGNAQFNGVGSQTAFRGGAGQVAIHEDADGNLLAAGIVYEAVFGSMGVPDNNESYQALAVARVPAAGGATQWVSAANTSDATLDIRAGKEILDGPGGNVVGRLTPLFDVTGGAPLGPSMSQPAFDSAGNIWFVASVALDFVDGMGNPGVDPDSALIRAVYDADTFTYELELVLDLGQVFPTQNSGSAFAVTFFGIADGNSISSGSFFSSNVSSTAFNGIDPSTLDQTDPRTNGGVILNAEIVYDSNLDGDIDTATGDQDYNVLLYIGHIEEITGPQPCNIADLALPFGVLDLDDVDTFISAFLAQDAAADLAPPAGIIDLDDVDAFIAAFLGGCP
ncbi:MAG: GC-type dockerin domain-anchored protein [Planctomycetota bacterium]